MDKITYLNSLEAYFNLMSMNGGIQVFRTAQQLRVFDALKQEASSPAMVANFCNLKEKSIELLLNVLYSLEAVEYNNGKYSLAPVMQFLTGNYQDLGNNYWNFLPELLKTGIPIVKMDNKEQSENQYKNQVLALEWMMKPSAEAAALMLDIGGKRKELQILDVGAGSSVWSIVFAQKDTKTVITALDWPAVLEIANVSAQRAGVQERFKALSGNYHEVELSDNTYDLVIVGNVTHIESPEGNQKLLKKLFKSLKSKGEIIIFDVFPGQKNGDLSRTLYALGLALRTENGKVYSLEELQNFLQRADFTEFSFSPIKAPPYTMGMLLAKKI